MKKISIAIVMILIVTTACSKTEVATEVVPTEVIPTTAPTYTPYPTFTEPPTETPEPTSTNTPIPTPTTKPTNTPSPSAWIWTPTLSDLYKHVYELGYSAEMVKHEDGYWLIYFYDPSSYYEAEGWYWYGNQIIAWAGGDGQSDDEVDQFALMKNYLTYPTSDIDGKADRFFRRLLDEFGYDDEVKNEIMAIASEGLVEARDAVDKQICYGQLSTGEYVAVWLIPVGPTMYRYRIDIRTSPIC